METMQAFARTDAGSLNVELMHVPVPTISDDDVLVSIEAFGVGIHDRYFIPSDAQFPYVIGIEGAGRIEAVGKNVTGFAKGDRVAFTSSMHPQGGSWAQYAAVSQSSLIHIPGDLSFLEAASVPVAGGTALQGLADLHLKAGETLFIAGASGAIGSFAIQLAAEKGIRVAGSASAKNLEYMRSLGAEETVDYASTHWPEDVQRWSHGGVDAALAIQPKTAAGAIAVTREGGRVITISGYGEEFPNERNISVAQMTHMSDSRQGVSRLLRSVSDGTIKTMIGAEYSFDAAMEALTKTETRHARGKLVVNVARR